MRRRQRAPSRSTTASTAPKSSSTDPTPGLYVPPMVWGTQYRYEPTRCCWSRLAAYDADDYIRDYGEFLAALD